MTTTVPKTSQVFFTPEDLLHLPDAVGYELVDGKLVERQMGINSAEVAARIIVLLGMFLREHRLGRIFTNDAGYRCFPDAPDKVRRPDVSFVRADRMRGDEATGAYFQIVPDLVIEVLSPNDLAYEVDAKIREYQRAGVPLIWVVNPETNIVRVHRQRSSVMGTLSEVGDGDTITGEDVLPGFSCPVEQFFHD